MCICVVGLSLSVALSGDITSRGALRWGPGYYVCPIYLLAKLALQVHLKLQGE